MSQRYTDAYSVCLVEVSQRYEDVKFWPGAPICAPASFQQHNLAILSNIPITNYYGINLIVQLKPNTWHMECCKIANTYYWLKTLFTCLWQIISHFKFRNLSADWNYEILNYWCSTYKHWTLCWFYFLRLRCATINLSPTSSVRDLTRLNQ